MDDITWENMIKEEAKKTEAVILNLAFHAVNVNQDFSNRSDKMFPMMGRAVGPGGLWLGNNM